MRKFFKLITCIGIIGLLNSCSKSQDNASEGGSGENSEEKIEQKTFMSYALNKYDTNKNGQLDSDETAVVEEIDCSKQGLTDLIGIEKFAALHTLNASNNHIVTYDATHSILGNVNLSNNKLTKVDFSKSGGTALLPYLYLNVSNNLQLKCIKVSTRQETAIKMYKNRWEKDHTAQYTTAVCN